MTTPRPSSTGADLGRPRTGEPTLDAVVRAVAAGDLTSFGALYDVLSPVVYGIARRVVRDADLAADVAQEVMLEVWRDAARYVPERGSVHAWVATIAHRRAVDRVRSVQSQRAREDRDATTGYRAAYDPVVEEVERKAEKVHVHDCLETLTENQRSAVLMAYFGARTYREVADELGTPLPTVKSRIRDGLSRLRTCLEVE